jgi:hypothetical protein
MSLATFERTWARANYWSMVALQPARLPATAQPDGFAQSAAALEAVNPKAAKLAYARTTAVAPASCPAAGRWQRNLRNG